MIPANFTESNRVLGPPEGWTKEDCGSLHVWTGDMDGHRRTISCWAPVRAEVEALAMGARVWLHVFGDAMPPVAIGCADPFAKQIEVVATGMEQRVIDPADPLELAAAAAAIDAIKDMVFPDDPTADAERVVERVAKLVHQFKLLRKELQK